MTLPPEISTQAAMPCSSSAGPITQTIDRDDRVPTLKVGLFPVNASGRRGAGLWPVLACLLEAWLSPQKAPYFPETSDGQRGCLDGLKSRHGRPASSQYPPGRDLVSERAARARGCGHVTDSASMFPRT